LDVRGIWRAGLTFALVLAVVGCSVLHRKQKEPAPGAVDADKYLFTRGTELLAKKNWLSAREYFKRIVDSYPSSIYRADAKLGVGDSYLGENHTDTLILAVNEFSEFLQFNPLNPRAAYAQYRLTLAQSKQMLSPERDQTATLQTLADVQHFRDAYPNSEYMPEVDKIYKQARDRLSESEFRVGMLYYRIHGLIGALQRFTNLLNDDPNYAKRDQVYYYLGITCTKMNLTPQAVLYYEKLLAEHPKSKFAKRAKKQLDLLKQAEEKKGKSGGTATRSSDRETAPASARRLVAPVPRAEPR